MRWIIGDIHGMRDALEALVNDIHRRDPAAALFFTGDLINRGPQSRQVVDFVLGLRNALIVRGNHDDVFDYVLSGQALVPYTREQTAVRMLWWFLQEGMDATLISYGISEKQIAKFAASPSPEKMADLCETIPAAHRELFRQLPAVINEPDFFLTHASWPVVRPVANPGLAEQILAEPALTEDLIWTRFKAEDLQVASIWSKRGFFGHTPVVHYPWTFRNRDNVPIVCPKIVLVDTGMALGPAGRLTAYCVEEDRFVQIDRSNQILEGP